MTSEVLLLERPAAGVAVLRLNRPQVLNALNLDLRIALARAFEQLEADAEIRVVVMAGSERAFCAGADLQEYLDAEPLQVVQRRMDRLWGAIASFRKPVIAAVRGYALGGGFELAMHADLVVAAHDARFGQPEVGIGLMPGGGATQRLTRVIGKFRAMRLLMTGANLSAEDACAWGLVSDLVQADQVETHALQLACDLAAGPRQALEFIKEAVLEGMNLPLTQGLQLERKSFQLLFDSKDKHAGIQARLHKHQAKFE